MDGTLSVYVPKNWGHELTAPQGIVLVGLPVAALLLGYVLLRVVWKVPTPPDLPQHALSSYGTVPQDEESQPAAQWHKTFDLAVLVGMAVLAVVLLVLTYLYKPQWLREPRFWAMQLPELAVMVLVSLAGGLVCRWFCDVDEKGYFLTTSTSKFKVNYTRKLQEFAAYVVPLVVKSGYSGSLARAWGDFFTMLGFLLMIKPIRERSRLCMLQFNSLDRPEDRPNALKWVILGNIAPGKVILNAFMWLFATKRALKFILVFITGIGSGLAEPVGMECGKHKYSVRSCSRSTFERSWESSACVFLSGMAFPALQFATFNSFTQVLAAMLVLAPTMAYTEAAAPDTIQTPVVMLVCGIPPRDR
jgi:dolichol kinase